MALTRTIALSPDADKLVIAKLLISIRSDALNNFSISLRWPIRSGESLLQSSFKAAISLFAIASKYLVTTILNASSSAFEIGCESLGDRFWPRTSHDESTK